MMETMAHKKAQSQQNHPSPRGARNGQRAGTNSGKVNTKGGFGTVFPVYPKAKPPQPFRTPKHRCDAGDPIGVNQGWKTNPSMSSKEAWFVEVALPTSCGTTHSPESSISLAIWAFRASVGSMRGAHFPTQKPPGPIPARKKVQTRSRNPAGGCVVPFPDRVFPEGPKGGLPATKTAISGTGPWDRRHLDFAVPAARDGGEHGTSAML